MSRHSRNGTLALAPDKTLPGGHAISWFALNRKARAAARKDKRITALEGRAQPWRKLGTDDKGKTLYSSGEGVARAPYVCALSRKQLREARRDHRKSKRSVGK